MGFWGSGIIEELKEKQLEVNHLERKAQREMNYGGVKFFVSPGGWTGKTKISNELGAIYEVANPSDFMVHNVNMVAPETWQQIESESQKMYDITGISRLSAQSLKPAGLDSGKALREYYDIESERFQHVIQGYEQSVLDVTNNMVLLAKEIDEKGEGGYEILAKDGNGLQAIKWKDVSIDRDKYIMQVYPTNFLPTTPAGKWQHVQEMLQAGFISKAEGMELLEYPDIEKVSTRANAPYRIIERDIEMILIKNEQTMPEPYYDLKLTGQIAQNAYLKAALDGYPEDKLEMLRRYIDRVKELTAPPIPPMPMGPMMPPEGMLPPEAEMGMPPIGGPVLPEGTPPLPALPAGL
jgi:hypothetical protein